MNHAPSMIHHEIEPASRIARHVERIWVMRGRGPLRPTTIELLPDGRVEVVLQVAGSGALRDEGRGTTLPRAFVVGQLTRARPIRGDGELTLVGMRLRPGGGRDLLRTPMRELADQIVPLDAVADRVPELAGCLAEAGDGDAAALLERWAHERIERADDANARIMATADAVMARGGEMTLDDVAALGGLGPRQLERRFLDAVGVGPKMLCRVARFAKALTLARRQPKPSWAGVAVACGYCDQPHLVRDFGRFAGEPPVRGRATREPERFWCAPPTGPAAAPRRPAMSDSSKTR